MSFCSFGSGIHENYGSFSASPAVVHMNEGDILVVLEFRGFIWTFSSGHFVLPRVIQSVVQ